MEGSGANNVSVHPGKIPRLLDEKNGLTFVYDFRYNVSVDITRKGEDVKNPPLPWRNCINISKAILETIAMTQPVGTVVLSVKKGHTELSGNLDLLIYQGCAEVERYINRQIRACGKELQEMLPKNSSVTIKARYLATFSLTCERLVAA